MEIQLWKGGVEMEIQLWEGGVGMESIHNTVWEYRIISLV